MKYTGFLIIPLIVFASALTFADSVYLSNGNRIDGNVVENDGNKVVVQISGGLRLTLGKEDVEEVELTGDYIPDPTASPTVAIPTPTQTPTVTALEIIARNEPSEKPTPDRERMRAAYRSKSQPRGKPHPVMRRAVPESAGVPKSPGEWEGVDPALAMKNFENYKNRSIVWRGTVRGVTHIAGSAFIDFSPDGANGAMCIVKLESTNTSKIANGVKVKVKGQIAGKQRLAGQMRNIVYALEPVETIPD